MTYRNITSVLTILMSLSAMPAIIGCHKPDKPAAKIQTSPANPRTSLDINADFSYMPCLSHTDKLPIIAIFNDEFRWTEEDNRQGLWECYRLIAAIWADGSVLWSANIDKGGQPYLIGQLEESQLDQLLADIATVELTYHAGLLCCRLCIQAEHAYLIINTDHIYYHTMPHKGCYQIYRSGVYEKWFVDDIDDYLKPMIQIEKLILATIPDKGHHIDTRSVLEPGKDFDWSY